MAFFNYGLFFQLKIMAYFSNSDFGDARAETLAHVAHSSSNYFIDIRSEYFTLTYLEVTTTILISGSI